MPPLTCRRVSTMTEVEAPRRREKTGGRSCSALVYGVLWDIRGREGALLRTIETRRPLGPAPVTSPFFLPHIRGRVAAERKRMLTDRVRGPGPLSVASASRAAYGLGVEGSPTTCR